MTNQSPLTALISLSIFLMLLGGCKPNAKKEIGFGTYENGVYTNDYFPLTINLPKDWSNQSDEQRDQLMQMGADIVTQYNDDMKPIIKASELQSACLLAHFKYEPGSPVPFNPSIMGIAENIKQFPGIKSGSDYQYHAKALMEQSNLPYDFSQKTYTEVIGGKEFAVMPIVMNMSGMKINQLYYSTVIKDYSLNVVLTYNNEEQLNELKAIIETLRFE